MNLVAAIPAPRLPDDASPRRRAWPVGCLVLIGRAASGWLSTGGTENAGSIAPGLRELSHDIAEQWETSAHRVRAWTIPHRRTHIAAPDCALPAVPCLGAVTGTGGRCATNNSVATTSRRALIGTVCHRVGLAYAGASSQQPGATPHSPGFPTVAGLLVLRALPRTGRQRVYGRIRFVRHRQRAAAMRRVPYAGGACSAHSRDTCYH